jgi:hypothetical protein
LSSGVLCSAMSDHSVPHVLDLPPSWLALFFQHVASGPGGLSNAAALGQTCKYLQKLFIGPAVTYCNLFLAAAISSPDHPVWQWLAERSGRISGLSLKLCLYSKPRGERGWDADEDAGDDADQLPAWMQRLQTLSRIPGLQLTVELVDTISSLSDPFLAQLLKQHIQIISHLIMEVSISKKRLKLQDLSEAVAPCRSLDLTISHHFDEYPVDLADLAPVAGTLRCLTCQSTGAENPGRMRGQPKSLRGSSAFSSMSQLTALELRSEFFTNEEPWGFLANLTSLGDLRLSVSATGDPSPLSALTRLSSLDLCSLWREPNVPVPFSFSSLQPLSTLEQLEVLSLTFPDACTLTSLQGLAGLSSLKQLGLAYPSSLKSLEGMPPGVVDFSITNAPDVTFSGIEGCTSMKKMWVGQCGVSSLQPLKDLSSLTELYVYRCGLTSLEGLNGMSLQSLTLSICTSLTDLSGAAHLTALTSLEVEGCGVTSLGPLSQLMEELQKLKMQQRGDVQKEVLELPHTLPTARTGW